MAKEEAWNLINQNHLDDNGINTNKKHMNNSKLAYVIVAISDEDVQLSSDESNKVPRVKHSEKILLCVLYQKSQI